MHIHPTRQLCKLHRSSLIFPPPERYLISRSTLTNSTGYYFDIGPGIAAYGEFSTTDSKGLPTCLTSWNTRFETPIGVYTHTVEYLGEEMGWRMPDLTSYLPGVAAVEQCTKIGMGGAPVALTPAREIILPMSTLPFTQKSATPTSSEKKLPEPTAAQPGGSTATALPITEDESREESSSSTRTERTGGSGTRVPPQADPTTTPGEDRSGLRSSRSQEDAPIEPASSSTSPRQQSTDVGPTRPSAPADDNQEPIDIEPVSPSQPASGNEQSIDIVPAQPGATNSPQEPEGSSEPSRVASVPGLGAVYPIGDNPETYSIGESTVLSAGGPAATIDGTIYTAQPSGSGVVATPVDSPDAFASFIAIGVSSEITSDDGGNAAYVVDNGGVTVVAGEQAATISGTTFTALPSAGGVVAIANGQSSTLGSFISSNRPSGASIVPVQGDSDGYVVGDDITIAAGDDAATISGTTYSALPSGAGVVAVAEGESTTVDRDALERAQSAAASDAYVLGGTTTISPGGSAAVISGTTYTVLASGPGIAIFASGTSTTLSGADITSAPQSGQGSNDAYVINGTATVSAGGSAATISGTTYSALPSGQGVVVVADGKTETIMVSATEVDSTARPSGTDSSSSEPGGGDTDNDNDGESVEPFAGQASSSVSAAGTFFWAAIWTGLVMIAVER